MRGLMIVMLNTVIARPLPWVTLQTCRPFLQDIRTGKPTIGKGHPCILRTAESRTFRSLCRSGFQPRLSWEPAIVVVAGSHSYKSQGLNRSQYSCNSVVYLRSSARRYEKGQKWEKYSGELSILSEIFAGFFTSLICVGGG